MALRDHSRVRRLATVGVFVVGIVATVATSPPSTTVTIPDATSTLHVDAEHPAALARVVVSAGPEVTSTSVYFNVSVSVGDVRAANGGAGDLRRAMRFVVTSATPGAVPDAPGEQVLPTPAPSAWQSEVTGPVTLPIQCGTGPCERAFWVIGQLSDPAVGALEADVNVFGYMSFPGNAYPSAAMAKVTIDPPISVAGSIPQLVVATQTEELRLGPRQPAAARIVEVGVGADAIRAAGTAVAAMSVQTVRTSGSSGYSDAGPLVSVYPLDEVDADPGLPLPSAVPTAFGIEPDPFAGCVPGDDCTRRFLVTFEWRGQTGEDEAYDWNVTLRRLDLVGAWSATSEMTASVERRFDLAAGSEVKTVHYQGESVGKDFNAPPQVQVGLSTSTTATDPAFRLLPAPAVLTYRTHAIGDGPVPSPDQTKLYLDMDLPAGLGGPSHISDSVGFAEVTVVTNPLAGCRVGAACQDLTIGTNPARTDPDGPLPTVPYEWSLDITLFEFAEAPLELLAIDRSPR